MEAYQNNCRLLVGLHAITRRIRQDIGELGPGIRAVAASDAPLPLVDKRPRLLMIYDKMNKSFRENGHFDKLRDAGLHVKIVKSLSDMALCGAGAPHLNLPISSGAIPSSPWIWRRS